MAADESSAIRALHRRREILDAAIAGQGGRIANTAGDSVIAEFPSAVAALSAALSAQRELARLNADLPSPTRMEFRIGLNLGEVIAQGGDLLGDGVNVAARIQELAPPGGVLLSAKIHAEVLGRCDAALVSIGPKRLKNIPVPAELYIAHEPGSAVPAAAVVKRPKPSARSVVAAVLALVIVAAGAWWQERMRPLQPAGVAAVEPAGGPPSVIVLPLANLSGDPALDYLSDGLTDELISALGRFTSITVLARYRIQGDTNRAQPLTEALARVGARYVVEGGVRRGANHVRVNARLSEATRGLILWSAQFEEPLIDLFAVQEHIARNIAGTLAARLMRIENARTSEGVSLRDSSSKELNISREPSQVAKDKVVYPTRNADAYETVLRARAALERHTRADNREARGLLERAIEIDPGYAAAHAGLARALHLAAASGWTEFPGDALARAELHAGRALAIEPASVEALTALSAIQTRSGQFDSALANARRALEINPSDAVAWHYLGEALTWSGSFREALPDFERALRLDPIARPEFWLAFALAHYQLRQHDEAVRIAERGLQHWPQFHSIRLALAAALAQAGRQDEAVAQTRILERAMPAFDPRNFGTRFRDPAHTAYALAGLERAGLR